MPEKIKYKKGMMMILVNQWINDQTKIIDEKEEVRLINLEGYIEDPDTGMMSDIQETSQESLFGHKRVKLRLKTYRPERKINLDLDGIDLDGNLIRKFDPNDTNKQFIPKGVMPIGLMRHTPFLKQAKFALLDQINELPSIGIDIFLSELTFEQSVHNY